MTELIYITLPFIGRIHAQHDRITTPRVSAEVLRDPCGKSLLLCCGRFRLYLSPVSTLDAEGR